MAQLFFCEFCEISKNTFFTEQLPPVEAASVTYNNTALT